MLLSGFLCAMIFMALVFGLLSGTLSAVSAAALDGARASVELTLAMCGMLCLWSGVMETMRRSGISEALSRLLRPLLGRLFPSALRDTETMDALTSNVSANLLGLGNAATPAGIRAAKGLRRLSGQDTASDELCRLVVLNTASIQLLPTTVAALRASLGADAPFDILPAVWLSSLVSVAAGLLAARAFERAAL